MFQEESVSNESSGSCYFHAVDCNCDHTPDQHNGSGCKIEGCSCQAVKECN